ncbi:protein KRI1 homolog [Zophobas morio]|uniref:protein KRI1 homolog n=1 Tax=Zophobas morio TaxID=2755281 RepID=UPI003082A62C
MIKSKDESIYDNKIKFFDDETIEEKYNGKLIKKEPKAFTLKDYEVGQLISKGAERAFNEEASDAERFDSLNELSYAEEQAKLKETIRKQAQSFTEDTCEDLFEIKKKTKEEEEKDTEDYLAWLKDQKTLENSRAVSELITLKRYWQDPNLDENEKFLRDYVLNKGWIDTTNTLKHDELLEEFEKDEEWLEKTDDFERKHNFRFEEDNSAELVHFGRSIPDSVRKENKKEKRKLVRQQRKERKAAKKREKQEELKRLKALKRQEIIEKLKEIQEITGVSKEGLEKLNVSDDEWNEEEHEKAMSLVFDENFYEAVEETKPVVEDEELQYLNEVEAEENTSPNILQENVKKKTVRKKNTDDDFSYKNSEYYEGDDYDFNMDADFIETDAGNHEKQSQDFSEATNHKRSRKDQQKFSTLLKKVAVSKHVKVDEILDDYYALDFEDLIDDLPVRFRYRKVIPNDFGLTPEEILFADDSELNRWVSLKKMTKYRSEQDELYDKKKYRKLSQRNKQKILTSLYNKNNSNNSESSYHNKHARTSAINQRSNQARTEEQPHKTVLPAQSWPEQANSANSIEATIPKIILSPSFGVLVQSLRLSTAARIPQFTFPEQGTHNHDDRFLKGPKYPRGVTRHYRGLDPLDPLHINANPSVVATPCLHSVSNTYQETQGITNVTVAVKIKSESRQPCLHEECTKLYEGSQFRPNSPRPLTKHVLALPLRAQPMQPPQLTTI